MSTLSSAPIADRSVDAMPRPGAPLPPGSIPSPATSSPGAPPSDLPADSGHGGLLERAQLAVEAAARLSTAAAERQSKRTRQQRLLLGAAAAVGLLSAAVVDAVVMTDVDFGVSRPFVVGLALIGVTLPALICLRRAIETPLHGEPGASVLTEIRTLEQQARSLHRLAREARKSHRPDPEHMLAGLIGDVERAMAAGAALPSAGPAVPVARTVRRHKRIRPRATSIIITTEDRRRLHAEIIDLSRSGVAVRGNLPGVWVGGMVAIGSRRAKTIRILKGGMAFEFSEPIAAALLTPDILL